MGVFYDRVPAEEPRTARAVIADALQTDPKAVQNVDAEAKKRAAELAPAGYAKFNAGRFIGALALFASIVAGAVVCEATDLEKSSDALWALAATVFGVVVGFLGGEKSASA
jgi:hypothetical protein